MKQTQNKETRESILQGGRKGQIEPREIMRLLGRNAEAFASSEKSGSFKPRDSALLSEKRGEPIRMKQILQEIISVLEQGRQEIGEV